MSKPDSQDELEQILNWLSPGSSSWRKEEAIERINAHTQKAITEAIKSLPRIQNDQYYFVSGKDIDKALAELTKDNPKEGTNA